MLCGACCVGVEGEGQKAWPLKKYRARRWRRAGEAFGGAVVFAEPSRLELREPLDLKAAAAIPVGEVRLRAPFELGPVI